MNNSGHGKVEPRKARKARKTERSVRYSVFGIRYSGWGTEHGILKDRDDYDYDYEYDYECALGARNMEGSHDVVATFLARPAPEIFSGAGWMIIRRIW